jgi:hypothetical protein
MIMPDFNDISQFEETEVSSQITAENSLEFFKACGIFYQGNAEIGQMAAALQGVKYSVQHLDQFKPIINKDPVRTPPYLVILLLTFLATRKCTQSISCTSAIFLHSYRPRPRELLLPDHRIKSRSPRDYLYVVSYDKS